MRDIIELFIDPEACAEEIIAGNSTKTIDKAIINIAQVALLIGFVVAIGIKSNWSYLVELASQVDLTFLGDLANLESMNAGLFSIIIVFVGAAIIIGAALLKALLMAVLLFIIKFLFRGQAAFKKLFLITIYSQVISVAFMLAGAVCIGVISMISMGTVEEIVLSIVMLFQYWYLIFIVVGFNAANRTGFVKSIVAALMMQSVLWGLQQLVPFGFLFF